MGYLKLLLISFLFILSFHFLTVGNNVYAEENEKYEEHEDDHGEYDEGEENNSLKEIGGMVGWGTVVSMGAAGLIFPMRRSTKSVITRFPSYKQMYLSFTKFIGKYHLFIGIAALALGGLHGVTMFLSEGELEGRGLIGLTAVIFMVLAAIVGSILAKNKKIRNIRRLHSILILTSIIVVFIHIVS